MKKISYFILLLLLSVMILCSCSDSSTEQNVSISEMYMNAAKAFTDDGDTKSAIKILEEGYEATGDESLKVMLDILGEKSADREEAESSEQSSEEESSGKYSAYNGSWSYSGWCKEASFNLDFRGDEFDISGSYSFYDYINDIENVSATFSSSGKIVDGVADIECVGSNGIPFSIRLTFLSKPMTDREIFYITCECLSFNGKTLEEIYGSEVDPKDNLAYFYNEESGKIFKTLITVENHCAGDYCTGYFSDGGLYAEGGNFVDFALDGNLLTVHYTSVGPAPHNRIAEIRETVDLSYAIYDENKIRVPFDEDGWGNSGVLNFEFNSGEGGCLVYCTTSDMVYSPDALWSIEASWSWYEPVDPRVIEPDLAMDDSERKTLNIFLSNFCETDFSKYNTWFQNKEEDNRQMMYFAFEHMMINTPAKIEYSDGFAIATVDSLNKVLERFLGRNLPDILPDMFYYKDNCILTNAITHLQGQGIFSLVTEMLYNDDGTIDVKFNLYANHGATDADVYAMTNYEARNACGTSFGRGEAKIKAKTYNNQNTYELISYQIY